MTPCTDLPLYNCQVTFNKTNIFRKETYKCSKHLTMDRIYSFLNEKKAKFAIKIQEKKLLLTRSVHFSGYKHELIYNANYNDLILFFDG